MKNLLPLRTIILAACFVPQLGTLSFQSHGAAGDLDLSFDPRSGVNGPVHALAVQPDGKVIIAGQFTTVKGLARSNLARLNADGTGDATFNPVKSYNRVHVLALQSDGKVLVGGEFVESCDDWDCYYPTAVIRLFTFPRDDTSEILDVTLTVETGTDLLTWPAVFVLGPDTAASNPGVSITENGSDPDTITATIPKGAGARRFARLKVAIAL